MQHSSRVSKSLLTQRGQPVSQLGLASQYLKESSCVATAFEAGINYFFSYNPVDDLLLQQLKPLLTIDRASIFIATGSESRQLDALRRSFEQTQQTLGLETIDAFFVEYIAPTDALDQVAAQFAQLRQWQTQGYIRYVGASTHNREVALRLIEQHQCDVLMLRYNMAHRKSEERVLPAAQAAGIPVVAFTCTRWGTLLKGHPQWTKAIPTAADCYRYVLHHPAVRVALTAPQTRNQLLENIKAIQNPALATEAAQQWQAYGDLIYGNGQDAFETQWV